MTETSTLFPRQIRDDLIAAGRLCLVMRDTDRHSESLRRLDEVLGRVYASRIPLVRPDARLAPERARAPMSRVREP